MHMMFGSTCHLKTPLRSDQQPANSLSGFQCQEITFTAIFIPSVMRDVHMDAHPASPIPCVRCQPRHLPSYTCGTVRGLHLATVAAYPPSPLPKLLACPLALVWTKQPTGGWEVMSTLPSYLVGKPVCHCPRGKKMAQKFPAPSSPGNFGGFFPNTSRSLWGENHNYLNPAETFGPFGFHGLSPL